MPLLVSDPLPEMRPAKGSGEILIEEQLRRREGNITPCRDWCFVPLQPAGIDIGAAAIAVGRRTVSACPARS